jgi:hypothetical protein
MPIKWYTTGMLGIVRIYLTPVIYKIVLKTSDIRPHHSPLLSASRLCAVELVEAVNEGHHEILCQPVHPRIDNVIAIDGAGNAGILF